MVAWQVPIVIILAIITILAVMNTLRLPVSRTKKSIYSTIRILLFTMLTIAFVEPAISIRRFLSGNESLPVLIDASESMSIFEISPILDIIDSCVKTASPKAQKSFNYYLFGDSLRSYAFTRNALFDPNDKRSFFPRPAEDKELASARELLIISDAFWSNASPAEEYLADKALWYVPLHPYRYRQNLSITVPDSFQCASEKPFMVDLPCNGRILNDDYIILKLFNEGKRISTDSTHIKAGKFSQQFAVTLPPAVSGLHLYTAVVSFSKDTSLSATRDFLVHAIPNSFRYYIVSDQPTFNQRFFKNALSGNSLFIPSKKINTADVTFIFNSAKTTFDSKADNLLSVYLGNAPGKTMRRQLSTPIKISPNNNYNANPFSDMQFDLFPPVAYLYTSTDVHSVIPLVHCTTPREVFPFVYQCIYQNHLALVCSFDGFWEWDFLPLSHRSGETEVFQFSRRMIAATTDLLYSLHTDTLLVFPTAQPSETSPVRLCIAASQTLSIENSLNINCTITADDEKTLFDTLLTVSGYRSLLHYFNLPQFPAGTYLVTCSLSTITGSPLVSKNMISITPDQSELTVDSQNEAFLREIGRPLDIKNRDHRTMLIKPYIDNKNETPVLEKFPLRRSWLILGFIIALFLLEWTMRRTDNLD